MRQGSPNSPSLITKITPGMTALKNKIRPMLMREISWIGKCELDEAGGWRQLIGPMQELRSDICIFIISPPRQGREGGRGKKGGEERFKEVETNRLRSVPCCVFGRLCTSYNKGWGFSLKCRLIQTACGGAH